MMMRELKCSNGLGGGLIWMMFAKEPTGSAGSRRGDTKRFVTPNSKEMCSHS